MSDEHEDARSEKDRTQRSAYQDERDDTIERLGKMDTPEPTPPRVDEAGGAEGSDSDPPAPEKS
ncbi:MAG: hypothetical protein M3Z06_01885 [Actinomycetota bacterium]|nr:hypothetical protein [Actinomycetota bacterium]